MGRGGCWVCLKAEVCGTTSTPRCHFSGLYASFCRDKEQELTRDGRAEVSPTMAPWRNPDPVLQFPASSEAAHAVPWCAGTPLTVTRNEKPNRGAIVLDVEIGV